MTNNNCRVQFFKLILRHVSLQVLSGGIFIINTFDKIIINTFDQILKLILTLNGGL